MEKSPRFCQHCFQLLVHKQKDYCSNKCQMEKKRQDDTIAWLQGKVVTSTKAEQVPKFIRSYLLKLYNYSCQACGWHEVNPTSGKVPVQIEHKDGNFNNNSRENLSVLCPNCHSLTSTFGNLNKGHGRRKRKLIHQIGSAELARVQS